MTCGRASSLRKDHAPCFPTPRATGPGHRPSSRSEPRAGLPDEVQNCARVGWDRRLRRKFCSFGTSAQPAVLASYHLAECTFLLPSLPFLRGVAYRGPFMPRGVDLKNPGEAKIQTNTFSVSGSPLYILIKIELLRRSTGGFLV